MSRDKIKYFLKLHEAVFGELAPVDAGILFGVDDVLLALGAAPLGLIGEKLDLFPAMGTLDIADLNVFLPAGALGKHKSLD